MSYLIDRQAVIDLLKQMRKDGDMVPWEGKDVFARIRKLPTIQPEKAQLLMQGTTFDLISRQAALDAIDSWRREYPLDLQEPIDDCWNAVKELPPAQPEIIRCKDCKYRYLDGMIWNCPFGLSGGEDFFCAYGVIGGGSGT